MILIIYSLKYILWNLNINIITMVFKARGMGLITREGSNPQFQLTLTRRTSVHGRHSRLIPYRLQNYE